MNEASMKTVGVSHLEMCIRDGYGTHAAYIAMIRTKVKYVDQPKAFAEHVYQLKMTPRNGVSRLHDEKYTGVSADYFKLTGSHGVSQSVSCISSYKTGPRYDQHTYRPGDE